MLKLNLIYLFAWEILLVKKLEIKTPKSIFIISVLKVSSISIFLSNKTSHENKWMRIKLLLVVIQLQNVRVFVFEKNVKFKTDCVVLRDYQATTICSKSYFLFIQRCGRHPFRNIYKTMERNMQLLIRCLCKHAIGQKICALLKCKC